MPLLPLIPWILGGLTVVYVASKAGEGGPAPIKRSTCPHLTRDQRFLLDYALARTPEALVQEALDRGEGRYDVVEDLREAAREVAAACPDDAQRLLQKALEVENAPLGYRRDEELPPVQTTPPAQTTQPETTPPVQPQTMALRPFDGRGAYSFVERTQPLAVGDVAIVPIVNYVTHETGDQDLLMASPSVPIPKGVHSILVRITNLKGPGVVLTDLIAFLARSGDVPGKAEPAGVVIPRPANIADEIIVGVDEGTLKTSRVVRKSPTIAGPNATVAGPGAPAQPARVATPALARMRCGVDGCSVRPEPRDWNDAWGRFGFSIPLGYPVNVIAMGPPGWVQVELHHPDDGIVDGWIEAEYLSPSSTHLSARDGASPSSSGPSVRGGPATAGRSAPPGRIKPARRPNRSA